MKLTLPDGRVIETSEPSHRIALLELQYALDGFREASEAIPEDAAHDGYDAAQAVARSAAERCRGAIGAVEEMFHALGVSPDAVTAFASRTMAPVDAFLG